MISILKLSNQECIHSIGFIEDMNLSPSNKIRNENAQVEYLLTDLIKIAFEQNKKIETVPIVNIIEALQPNTQEELLDLEKITS